MSDMPFRSQTPARSNWEFLGDNNRGLAQAVRNNQPLLALEYAVRLISEMEERIAKLEAKFDVAHAAVQAKPAKVSVGATPEKPEG